MSSASLAIILHLLFVAAPFFLLQSLVPRLFLGHETVSVKKSAELPLRFRYDGAFKILQAADLRYGSGGLSRCRDVAASEYRYCSDLNTTRFLRRIVDAESPYYVAFTGDNILGASKSDAAESLIDVFAPVIESKLP